MSGSGAAAGLVARSTLPLAIRVFDHSGEELQIEEGTLYPALHRLEDRGWVQAEWGLSENYRRAKFYLLTAAGRAELAERVLSWSHFTCAVDRFIEATPANA